MNPHIIIKEKFQDATLVGQNFIGKKTVQMLQKNIINVAPTLLYRLMNTNKLKLLKVIAVLNLVIVNL